MYTHRNIIWTAESIGRLAGRDVLADARLVSYLPLAHAAERSTSHWSPLWHCAARGATGTVRYCPDLTQLLRYLIETRPTIFVGVPRVWEKLQAAIRAGAAAEPDEQRRAMVLHALDVAHQVAGLRHQGKPVPAELDAAHAQFAPVYAAIRAKLGFDQCRWADHVGRADAAGRGAVLRRDRPAAAGDVGDERADRSGHRGFPARRPVRHLRRGHPRRRGAYRRGRRADRPRWERDGRLLPRTRSRPRRPSDRAAGCTPATSPRSTRTATTASSTARKN